MQFIKFTCAALMLSMAFGQAANACQKRVDQEGLASYYNLAGRKTATGELFDANAMNIAHKNIPLGTQVKVTSLETKKSVIATVNDRGPFIKNRIVDLTPAVVRELGLKRKKGVYRVQLDACH